MYMCMYMQNLQKIIRIQRVSSRAIHVESLPSASYCYNYDVYSSIQYNRNCEYISQLLYAQCLEKT